MALLLLLRYLTFFWWSVYMSPSSSLLYRLQESGLRFDTDIHARTM